MNAEQFIRDGSLDEALHLLQEEIRGNPADPLAGGICIYGPLRCGSCGRKTHRAGGNNRPIAQAVRQRRCSCRHPSNGRQSPWWATCGSGWTP